MDVIVAAWNLGDAVVHGMRHRQAAALEAQARQQVVGLHHPFQCRGGGAGLHRCAGRRSIGQQDVTAKLGQGAAGAAGQASHHVVAAALAHAAGLKPGGQGIAQPSHQLALRGAGHHLRIHQHQQRMAVVEAEPLHAAALGVDHRQGAARGVGAGEGGGDYRRQIQLIRHGPSRIRSLAAAGPHQGHGLATAGLGHQPVDFRLAAFATEGDHHRLQAHLRQHLLPDRLQIPLGRAAGHEQHPAAQPQPLQLPPQLMGSARPLHVAPRAGEHRERALVETDHRAGVGHGSERCRGTSTHSKAAGPGLVQAQGRFCRRQLFAADAARDRAAGGTLLAQPPIGLVSFRHRSHG